MYLNCNNIITAIFTVFSILKNTVNNKTCKIFTAESIKLCTEIYSLEEDINLKYNQCKQSTQATLPEHSL